MTAMLLTRHGDFDALVYRHDVATPVPAFGEVLIRVGAAGINNTDINTRTGWYSTSPGFWRQNNPRPARFANRPWAMAAGAAIRSAFRASRAPMYAERLRP